MLTACELLLMLLAGLAFGSFATVACHRIPRGASVAAPGSACPRCGGPLAWHDNIPVVSYLLLRARCRACREPISPRYPAVEVCTGAVWVAIFLRIGPHPALPAFLALGTTLVIVSVIDLEHGLLPNRVLVPAALAAVVLLVGAAVAGGHWARLRDGTAGGLAYGLAMLVASSAAPRATLGGKVWFGPYLGVHLGWLGLRLVALGVLMAGFMGSVSAILLFAAGRRPGEGPFPDIPNGLFMALGALGGILFGRIILRSWPGI